MSDGFTFDQEKHLYRLDDGRIVPGHTRVLDLGGLVPYKAIDLDILERKSALGRETHAATLLYDQNKKVKVDRRVEPFFEAWLLFRRETGFAPFLREYRDVYSIDGMPFGMQIDALGRFPGDRRETCVELKTCATILPHHGVQLAAQAAGVKQNGILSPLARFLSRQRVVVQLKPNGRYKRHDFEKRSDFEAFTRALGTTYWKLEHQKIYRELTDGDSTETRF